MLPMRPCESKASRRPHRCGAKNQRTRLRFGGTVRRSCALLERALLALFCTTGDGLPLSLHTFTPSTEGPQPPRRPSLPHPQTLHALSEAKQLIDVGREHDICPLRNGASVRRCQRRITEATSARPDVPRLGSSDGRATSANARSGIHARYGGH